MPISASLGALSYTKLGAGNLSNYWYAETNGNYPFVGLVLDPSKNITVGGGNYLIQFVDLGVAPRKNWSITFDGPGANESLTDLKYSSYYDAIGIVYTETYQSSQFPYPTLRRTLWKMVATNGVIPPFSYGGGNQGAQPNSGTNLGIYSNTFAVNENNGYYYEVGYQKEPFQSGVSIQCNQFSNATDTGALLAYGGLYSTSGTAPVANGTGGQVDSNGYLTWGGYTQTTTTGSTRYAVLTKSEKTITTTPTMLVPVWQRKITLNANITSSRLVLDSSDNTYFLVNEGTSTNGYLLKYNTSGVLQWQRKITGTNLTAITLDSSNNIFVAGKNSSNNLFIAKYNSSGTIQWQTKLSGATFAGTGIQNDSSVLYVGGSVGSQGFVIKLPNDGSIPGDGSYYIGGSTTLVYSIATQGESAGSLVDASNFEYPYNSTTSAINSSINGPTLIESNTIINLT